MPMSEAIAGIFFASILLYAVLMDVLSLRIPNLVSIALIIGFFVYALAARSDWSLKAHLFAAAITFAIAFILYSIGWFGGGDAKLVTAIMLWAGPNGGATFLVRAALAGGALALAVMLTGRLLRVYPSIAQALPEWGLVRWARLGVFPYSIPLAAAALSVLPSILAKPA